jgi:hypothetical protein
MQELPFMASENVIMAMVKMGGNRQVRIHTDSGYGIPVVRV